MEKEGKGIIPEIRRIRDNKTKKDKEYTITEVNRKEREIDKDFFPRRYFMEKGRNTEKNIIRKKD